MQSNQSKDAYKIWHLEVRGVHPEGKDRQEEGQLHHLQKEILQAHRRNEMKKFRNTVLKSITALAVLIMILSICSADSESYLPMVTLAISMVWLVPFAIANNWAGR